MQRQIVKLENQNQRMEPTGLASPGQTRGSTAIGPGLVCQGAVGQIFDRVWNRTDPCLGSYPGPPAGYWYLLLTLPYLEVEVHCILL